jgi:uncharacterized protein YndB with AHSA1/START domain
MRNINHNAPVTYASSIAIQASPERVWSVLTDIDGWASWQNDIRKPKLKDRLVSGGTFVWTTGGIAIHSELHTVEPQRTLGWTGTAPGTFAIHNWNLKAHNSGTLVSVEESMEGFLVRLFKNLFRRNLEKSLNTWLQLLKGASERA